MLQLSDFLDQPLKFEALVSEKTDTYVLLDELTDSHFNEPFELCNEFSGYVPLAKFKNLAVDVGDRIRFTAWLYQGNNKCIKLLNMGTVEVVRRMPWYQSSENLVNYVILRGQDIEQNY